ncbi:MAG TPA: leucyl aminopeptidase [Anaerohalosphaeraceae bacterium]|jgi:leucyl aminopeptidase|nr:leucyl aminopeptidase [Anaerohalosphaeraceae bacterium]HRT49882.1 leucyl aminopeptidase [Anaerohalosphaeraceae bacterium]HRT86774.1 leucyl aminopeptidase [Anaerohalosphaeraceae bacterium]
MSREIIKIKVGVGRVDAVAGAAEVTVVGVFSDGKGGAVFRKLDKALNGGLSQVLGLGDFKGEANTTAVVYGNKAIGARRVVMVGLGDRAKLTVDAVRQAAGRAASMAVDLKAKKAIFALHGDLPKKLRPEALGQAIAEGVHFGAYRWDEFLGKGNDKDGRPAAIGVVIAETDAAVAKALGEGVKVGNIMGEAQNFARTIMNRPANVVNPPSLAAEAKRLAARTPGLTCSVMEEKQIRAKGMGGLMAVGQGSATQPRLIVLKYSPARARGRTIGLVGKAITFDSGGISIKPSEGMQEMKFDKSGGVAVLGAMKAIAALKPPVQVYGIIPSAENMPGGMSYRPGDIVTTYSGKTVEIQNTDAEGRMILCDAIHHAVMLKCDVVVDVATLTGASVVALGEWRAALMSHSDRLIERIKAASEACGENVWHMPCGEEYLELMKSKIADLKNIGGKWGGACTAAAFLGEFARDVEWAHLDIAGVGMVDGSKKFGSPGSIGYGVRLLTTFVRNEAE